MNWKNGIQPFLSRVGRSVHVSESVITERIYLVGRTLFLIKSGIQFVVIVPICSSSINDGHKRLLRNGMVDKTGVAMQPTRYSKTGRVGDLKTDFARKEI